MTAPPPAPQDQTIVIYRLGSLGDTVVALPCFHRIVDSFPGARRLVLTNRPVSSKAAPLEAILGPGSFIDGVIEYPIRTRDPGELLRVAGALRSTGADTLIYLGGGRGRLRVLRDVALFRACGLRRIIGAPLSRDLEHPRLDAAGCEEPEAERLARCLAPLGPIDLHARSAWDLRLTPEELREGDAVLEPFGSGAFIAVNTGGKVAEKDWGEAAWAAMLTELARRAPGLGLLFLGASDDSGRAERLATFWRGPSVNACGMLSPRASAAALRRASAFVGHDSGPLHLAAAMGVRCIGLFGGYNRPRRWHPYGQGHHVFHELDGVSRIEPRAVADAAGRMLQREFAA